MVLESKNTMTVTPLKIRPSGKWDRSCWTSIKNSYW